VFLSFSGWTVCCGLVTSPANHIRFLIHDQADTSAEDILRSYKFQETRIQQIIGAKERWGEAATF
jgi:hypothetical protein